MNKRRMLSVFSSFPIAVFILFMSVTILIAYSSSPPDGRTGVDGGPTCIDGCHVGSSLNSGGGTFNITTDIPTAGFTLGETYTVTVSINESGSSRQGFEANILDQNGEQAGTITVTNSSATTTSTTSGITYIKHNVATSASNASWTFDWVAPSSDVGTVTFYAAGNAANGDNAATGDHIYTASTFTSADLTTSVSEYDPRPDRFELIGNYPNPFNPETTIRFQIPMTTNVTLKVYDMRGQLIKTLISGQLPGGSHNVKWDGTNERGIIVATGVYIYRIQAGNFTDVRKMLFIK